MHFVSDQKSGDICGDGGKEFTEARLVKQCVGDDCNFRSGLS